MSEKIICNHCKRELSKKSTYDSYFLKLEAIRATIDEVVIDIYIIPPIEEDKHFCGLACLKNWLAKDLEDIHDYVEEE